MAKNISGDQSGTPGYEDADDYFGDPTTQPVTDSFHAEHDIGKVSFVLAKLKSITDDIVNLVFPFLPTSDQKAAMDAANSPSGANAFATVADAVFNGGEVTADIEIDKSLPALFLSDDGGANVGAVSFNSGAGELVSLRRADSQSYLGISSQDANVALDVANKKIINVATPTSPTDAANKDYADAHVKLSGDTMTGNLTIDNSNAALFLSDDGGSNVGAISFNSGGSELTSLRRADNQSYIGISSQDANVALDVANKKIIGVTTPTVATDAANKDYADAHVKLSGGTMTGDLTVDKSLPALFLSDNGGTDAGAISFNSGGGELVSLRRANNSSYLGISSQDANVALDVATKKIIRVATPTAPTDAANKDYADAHVKLSGDTMTGNLTIDNSNAALFLSDNGGSNVGAISFNSGGSELTSLRRADNQSYIGISSQDANIALDVGNKRIINLQDPTNSADAATKSYVDSPPSDIKFKNIVSNLEGPSSLEILRKIDDVEFTWKDDAPSQIGKDTDKGRSIYGHIAQQVQEALPDAVYERSYDVIAQRIVKKLVSVPKTIEEKITEVVTDEVEKEVEVEEIQIDQDTGESLVVMVPKTIKTFVDREVTRTVTKNITVEEEQDVVENYVESTEDYLSVQREVLLPHALAVIKYQATQIEDLQARVAALEV